MRYYKIILLMALIVLVSCPAFSQDEKAVGDAPAPEMSQPMPVTADKAVPENAPQIPAVDTAAVMSPAPAAGDISIYGEIKTVNVSANSMTVQYYDYDSDEERAADIAINKDTKLENAVVIGDIKQGDWVY